MTFDPEALAKLSGPDRPAAQPVPARFLIRVGLAAGLAAALCNVVLFLVGRGADWDLTVDDMEVRPLPVVIVCLVVGMLAAVASYVAARVTKRPAVWVAVAGTGLWLASIQAVPPAVAAMHTVAALWIVGFLTKAVRGGTHLR